MIKKSNLLYLKNNFFYNFKVGDVIKIFYIIRKRNKKRVYNLIGLCLFKNVNNFMIYNKLKKEKIQMTFTIFSPAILKIFLIKMYKPFVFRITNIYFKRNLFLKEDFFHLNFIESSLNSYTFEIVDFLFKVSTVGKRKKKKMANKYKYRNLINFKEFATNRKRNIDKKLFSMVVKKYKNTNFRIILKDENKIDEKNYYEDYSNIFLNLDNFKSNYEDWSNNTDNEFDNEFGDNEDVNFDWIQEEDDSDDSNKNENNDFDKNEDCNDQIKFNDFSKYNLKISYKKKFSYNEINFDQEEDKDFNIKNWSQGFIDDVNLVNDYIYFDFKNNVYKFEFKNYYIKKNNFVFKYNKNIYFNNKNILFNEIINNKKKYFNNKKNIINNPLWIINKKMIFFFFKKDFFVRFIIKNKYSYHKYMFSILNIINN